MLKLAIVIVNWNNFPDTRACLNSVFAADCQNFSLQLFVVDNGSTDDSLSRLREEFGARVEILASEKNLGFAGGNNLAIRRALAHGADLVLLLNNDTIVADDVFQKLLEACLSYPDFGIFGGKIYYHTENKRLWYAGGEIYRGLARTRHLGFGKLDSPIYQKSRPVSFITGCLMLIRREVFEKIGLLEESLFLYFEDVEFCLRAARQNIAMLYVPAAVISHKVGAGGRGQYTPHYLYYQTRNRYLVLQKAGGWLYHLWLLPLHIFLYGALRAAVVAIFPDTQKWPRIRAIWQGCWDGLRGRVGQKKVIEE